MPAVKKKARKILLRAHEQWARAGADGLRTIGVTQSMLGAWLACREQCRMAYIEGWTSSGFNKSLFFGGISHEVMEGVYAPSRGKRAPSPRLIESLIAKAIDRWKRNQWKGGRMSGTDLEDFTMRCILLRAVLPAYFKKTWSSKEKLYDDRNRVYRSIEHKFSVPVTLPLPGNPVITLRGMMDGVFDSTRGTVKLTESKNLIQINEDTIVSMLEHDLQLLTYFKAMIDSPDIPKVSGCIYNVLRVPSLRWKQSETSKEFVARIHADIDSRPDHYFFRYQFSDTQAAIQDRIDQYLMPILCEFYKWHQDLCSYGPDDSPSHYMNPTALTGKYGKCGLFNLLLTGETAGYERRRHPFPELA